MYFGYAYFGGAPYAPIPVPPVPPKPPKTPSIFGGGGHKRHKNWTPSELQDFENRRIATINDLIHEEIDEEDIALTVCLWLNIK